MQQVPADERAAEVEEGVVERVVALVAHEQAAVAVQPGEAALHDPAVPAEPRARLDARAGDARGDAPAAEQRAILAGAVALVGMQLGGAPARPARAPRRLAQRGD